MTAGTISSVDGSTIVVKTTDNKTVKVTTSSTTAVQVTSKISLADLAKGDTVTVIGQTANGTVTATTIRRGDGGFGGFGGFGGRGGRACIRRHHGPVRSPVGRCAHG